jgi:hypothetical protein
MEVNGGLNEWEIYTIHKAKDGRRGRDERKNTFLKLGRRTETFSCCSLLMVQPSKVASSPTSRQAAARVACFSVVRTLSPAVWHSVSRATKWLRVQASKVSATPASWQAVARAASFSVVQVSSPAARQAVSVFSNSAATVQQITL